MKFGKLAVCAAAILGTITSGSLAFADSIDDFNNSWVGQTLEAQRALDVYAPMSDNSFFGSHNTYNSEVYSTLFSYVDPQQKVSIKDQLRMGARFIEMDAHVGPIFETEYWNGIPYTVINDNELILCHGVCSMYDKKYGDGLDEVVSWLQSDNAKDQVIILYIEDHIGDSYQDNMRALLKNKLGNYVYESGHTPSNCGSIPNDLTKADVLSAGKNVLIWKDNGCSSDSEFAAMAYDGLGGIDRAWEDATSLSAIADFFNGGSTDLIEANEVLPLFELGKNLVNLDDMVTTDGRLEAGIWSWGVSQPDGGASNPDADCAIIKSDGRWYDRKCENTNLPYACEDDSGNWAVTSTKDTWSKGDEVCAALGGTYKFSMPTNAVTNKALTNVSSQEKIWINHNDIAEEGQWDVNGQNTSFSYETSQSVAFKSAHNKYFVSENGGGGAVNANRSSAGSWETFDLVNSSIDCLSHGDSVYVRSVNNYYWSAQSNGNLDGNRTAAGSWETFTLVNHSDSSGCLANNDVISLKSVHSKFVVAESNGDANANRSSAGSWEKFTVQFK